MKMLRLLFLFVFAASLVRAGTPLTDVRLSGTGNSVQSGATMTWQSGSTISVDSGATVTGLQRTNSTLTSLAGTTFSSFSLSLMPDSTRTAWFDAIAPASPGTGDVIYFNGSHWIDLGIGTSGQVLTVSSGLPAWVGSAAGAPNTSTYILQVADGSLSNAQALGALTTGIMKSATTTGIVSIAAAGTDYVAPGALTSAGLTMSTARVLGRVTSSTGAVEELTFSSLLDQVGNTRGALLERGSSGWTTVTPGTSGYVLTSNGPGSDPTWQASGGGGGSIGGSSGSTDNALIRADGTGGATVQSSNVTLADSGTAFVFSGAAGLTAGGSNQNVTLTPSGTGVLSVTNQVLSTGGLATTGYTSTAGVATAFGVSSGNGYFQSLTSGVPNSLSIDASPLIFRGYNGSYVEWGRVSTAGNLLVGTTSDSGLSSSGNIHATGSVVVGGSLTIATHTPSSSSDTGVTGTIAWDGSFLYVCTATNTWARIALVSF